MESGWPSSSVHPTADACFCGCGAARRLSATTMMPGGIPLQPDAGRGSPARSNARCRCRWLASVHGFLQLQLPQRLARPVLTSAAVRPYRCPQRLLHRVQSEYARRIHSCARPPIPDQFRQRQPTQTGHRDRRLWPPLRRQDGLDTTSHVRHSPLCSDHLFRRDAARTPPQKRPCIASTCFLCLGAGQARGMRLPHSPRTRRPFGPESALRPPPS